jgi:hypothetical protein
MDNKPNTKSMYVRAVPRARQALKRLLAEMAVFEEGVTQEVFVTASWLWMESMDAEGLHKELTPHLIAVREALDAGRDVPETIKVKPKRAAKNVKMSNPPGEKGGSKTG